MVLDRMAHIALVKCLLLYLCSIHVVEAGSRMEWTWISDNSFSPSNSVPAARSNAVGWYDKQTKELWLFGGQSTSGAYHNDLWKYSANDTTWTWVSGSNFTESYGIYGNKNEPSAENCPGGRARAVGWYDSSLQEFWLFGGYGYNAISESLLNDLWRYRVNDSTWTWITGDNFGSQFGVYGTRGYGQTINVPGSRESATGWYDSNTKEFWLFGGYGNGQLAEGYLNDLWKYRLNDSTWTWVSGSASINEVGKYGTKGNSSSNDFPGARQGAVSWYDSSTNEFWLFGGFDGVGRFNDLWRYQVSDDLWTWMHGSNTVEQPGFYGVKGVANSSNVPGSRFKALGWFDRSVREFWLFGGEGYAFDPGEHGKLNDLWRYQMNDSTWTWMSGSSQVGQSPSHENPGLEEIVPSGRCDAVGWYDSSAQEFWLFGGEGFVGNDTVSQLNDMWKASWVKSEIEPLQEEPEEEPTATPSLEPEVEPATPTLEPQEADVCPSPFLQVNNTCIPLNCASDDTSCSLECNNIICVIEGNLTVNGSIVETKTISIVGVVNVTGDVVVVDEVIVKISPGATLHVEGCLVLDDNSQIVVVVDGEMKNENGSVVATYNGNCSSQDLVERVRIETTSSVDECRDGKPMVVEEREGSDSGGGRRARLELLFVPMSESGECSAESELNVLAIAVAVPIAVLVILIIVIVLAVPKIRNKVFPFANRKHMESSVKL